MYRTGDRAMSVLRWLALSWIFLTPMLCAAQPAVSVLDLNALPKIDSAGRDGYRDLFLVGATPRAWAVAPDGKYGGGWGARSLEEARARALKSCADKGGQGCAIYAENLDVVWPGKTNKPRTAPPPRLIGDAHYEIGPDDRFFWYGPQTARGILVFGHGYGGPSADGRSSQPPGWTRSFNNVGYDVVRFARDPGWDGQRDEVGEWLRVALAELRKRGWKQIIVAGQSRGAYNALQTLDTPGLADVVIAASTAAFGATPGANHSETNLWTMFGAAASPQARVAYIQFTGDEYTPDLEARTALVNRRLKPGVGSLLMIDRPEGFSTHFGQTQPLFASKFGPCLLRFATDAAPPSAC